MRKLIIRLLIFAVIFVIADRAIGYAFSSIRDNAIDGETLRQNTIVERTTASVVLMGSSRYEHHYDPRILEKELHMTCYNAGQGGHGILMMYPYYKMLSSRYRPELIIYEIGGYDVMSEDYTRDLEFLRQYYGRPVVDSVAVDIDPMERYKMMCQAYHYNGKALTIIVDALQHKQPNIMGYRPINGTMKGHSQQGEVKRVGQKNIDSFKRKYLVKLIQDCKHNGTCLVFAVSPSYKGTAFPEYHKAISDLCSEYHVTLLYHNNDLRFINNERYFSDGAHMNHLGAEKYTKVVAEEIKRLKLHRQ